MITAPAVPNGFSLINLMSIRTGAERVLRLVFIPEERSELLLAIFNSSFIYSAHGGPRFHRSGQQLYLLIPDRPQKTT